MSQVVEQTLHWHQDLGTFEGSTKRLEAGQLGDVPLVVAGIGILSPMYSGLNNGVVSSLSITTMGRKRLTVRDQLLIWDFGIAQGASSSIGDERRVLTIVVWLRLVWRQEIRFESGCNATASLVAGRWYFLYL